jgi:hypothetical protein
VNWPHVKAYRVSEARCTISWKILARHWWRSTGRKGLLSFRHTGSCRRRRSEVGHSSSKLLWSANPHRCQLFQPANSSTWLVGLLHLPVTDYGDDQPLLYESVDKKKSKKNMIALVPSSWRNRCSTSYYSFPPKFYKARWHSNGLSELTQRVLACLKEAGMEASQTTRDEPRGRDGLVGPAPCLDHGVFIPFMLM